MRIVKKAAEICFEDIGKRYDLSIYSNLNNFFQNINNEPPKTLVTFIEGIILRNKKGEMTGHLLKFISIAHAIIAATRPRSFLSAIQVGVGAYVHQKFGSGLLQNILHKFGFSASYQEIKRFEVIKMAAKTNGLDDKVVKMEVDYTSTLDDKLAEAKKMAGEGNLYEALELLLSLEKQTRTNVDLTSTSRVLVTVVQICHDAKNWTALNEHIVLLSKRRSQIKEAVTKMVQECCKYVDTAPSKEIKIKLIDTLRTVTEGKIYVEVERARLTHILAKMKEDDGDIQGAATIIQELQVETYGSMEKKEKVELILEQMRLCLAKRDYIRTQIISKKINTKFFEDETTSELKLKYYRLMIQLEGHEGSYLNTCKHYRAILNTKFIEEDPEECQATLQNVVLFLILAPYSNEQADLTHRVYEEKALDQIPVYKEMLKLFMTAEVIQWSSLCEKFEKELKTGSSKLKATDVFDSTEGGQKRWKDLKIRVAEHNIRIMAKYYTRITLKRMAELLDLPIEETEEFLSNMVTSKTVMAKTDRPAGIVNFASMKDPTDVLNDWANHISSLMKLVNHTTHLINKEQMVYMHLMASATVPPPVESASN